MVARRWERVRVHWMARWQPRPTKPVIGQAWRFAAQLQGYWMVARRREPVTLHWTARSQRLMGNQ